MNRVIRIGLVFLVLASAWKLFVHAMLHVPEGVADGVTGLLYGISIGTMLLGIFLQHSNRGRFPNGR